MLAYMKLKMIKKPKTLESTLELGEKVLGSRDQLNHLLRNLVFALDGNKPINLIKTEWER